MKSVDPVQVEEDLELSNLLEAVLHKRDRVVTYLDVNVDRAVIHADAKERRGGLRRNDHAASDGRA